MPTAAGIDVQCFLDAAMVTFAFAPFLVALCEHLLADAANAVAVPECHDKVHPFLGAVTAGRAVKEVINARVSLIQQGDEVILVRGFLFHVEAELVIHGF